MNPSSPVISVAPFMESLARQNIEALAEQAAVRSGAEKEQVLLALYADARFQELLRQEQLLRKTPPGGLRGPELLRVALSMADTADRVAERLAGAKDLTQS